MKSMTCKQLGGACDKVFKANTFEEMASLSKEHGMEMFMIKDVAHIKAMETMQELLKTPEAMQNWLIQKMADFDALPSI